MDEVKDYRELLHRKSDEVESIAQRYPLMKKALETFLEINREKVDATSPEIMFYGIYNAGKSSILNEIVGEDIAPVGDIPTTKDIRRYQWRGYNITDTPGIDAPVADEEVTQSHLKKADVVLFVMGTKGSYENLTNYRRMKEIADDGKKIIIVLNDMNAYLSENPDMIDQIKGKVAENMRQVKIRDVDTKFEIIAVNAQDAKDGRECDEPELIAQSRIEYLRGAILHQLQSSNSFQILRNAVQEMEKILDSMIEQTGESSSGEIRNSSEILERFEEQKRIARKVINEFIESQTANFGSVMPAIIWEDRSNANQILEREIDKLNDRVLVELNQQLEDMYATLQAEFKAIDKLQVTNDINFNEMANQTQALVANTSSSFDLKDAVDQTKQTIDLIEQGSSLLKGVGIGTLVSQVAKKVGIANLIPGGGQVITGILTIGTLLSSLSKGNQDAVEKQIAQAQAAEERRQREEERKRQDLEQKMRYVANDISSQLRKSTSEILNSATEEILKPFKAKIESMKSEGKQVIADIDKLREIRNEYDLIKIDLGAK
ncbi:MAG: dynamin family protein [Selenomonadaceae bacterium]|nr:dynamin family protein [Selenomonadaceae bacterium]